MTALLGVLLFINRQFAGAFDTFLFWIVPLPVIIYQLRFGLKQTFVLAVSMLVITFIIATPVTVFYVAGSIVAGIVYGYGVKKGWSALQLIVAVFAISFIMAIITTFVAAGFFGYDLVAEIEYLQTFVTEIFTQSGLSEEAASASYLTSTNFILIIIVISTIITSIMEGILVHLLAYIVLRRLKMDLPPMKSMGEIYCPKWLRFVVFVVLFAYILQMITQVSKYEEIVTIGLTIVMFVCMVFGYLFMVTVLTIRIPQRRQRTIILLVLIVLSLFIPYILITVGLLDIFTNIRQNIVKEYKNGKGREQ